MTLTGDIFEEQLNPTNRFFVTLFSLPGKTYANVLDSRLMSAC